MVLVVQEEVSWVECYWEVCSAEEAVVLGGASRVEIPQEVDLVVSAEEVLAEAAPADRGNEFQLKNNSKPFALSTKGLLFLRYSSQAGLETIFS
jgi:hypothetical protein